jgi:hypothetical protein
MNGGRAGGPVARRGRCQEDRVTAKNAKSAKQSFDLIEPLFFAFFAFYALLLFGFPGAEKNAAPLPWGEGRRIVFAGSQKLAAAEALSLAP